jgi:cytochrome c biogenesis protein CcmG/thiol:disulfide interchange protein DsbE
VGIGWTGSYGRVFGGAAVNHVDGRMKVRQLKLGEALRGMSRRRKAGIGAWCLAIVAVIAVVSVFGGSSSNASRSASPALAKPFTLHVLGHAGSSLSLSHYAGHPVIVNFFASWCTPCQQETPLLARFYASHHGKVAVIGVDVNDGTAAALRFDQRSGVRYPVVTDPLGATATSYGVVGIPQTFFLDAQQRVVKHVFGALSLAGLNAGLARAS